MRIAIIGAGVAGLSCAHELERYGINPVVFEDLDFIGDREPHITASLNVADRPVADVIAYYEKVCHLRITPLNTVKKLTHYSPSKRTVIENGNFGYFFKRGKDEDSLKRQIHAQLANTQIIFGAKPDYKALAAEYDFVVVADGRPDITKELGCWTDLIGGWVKGAIVEDAFNIHELIMWIDRRYNKNGYVYLCPFDTHKASLLLFVPSVQCNELNYYWDQFLKIANINYRIVETFFVHHLSGVVQPHRMGNIFFAGNAAGAISPFLGFGQLNSISMGVFVAQSIIEGSDYEALLKPILEKEAAFYEIRKAFNTLSNREFDRLVCAIGLPGIKQLIYNTNINVVKYSAKLLKLANALRGGKKGS